MLKKNKDLKLELTQYQQQIKTLSTQDHGGGAGGGVECEESLNEEELSRGVISVSCNSATTVDSNAGGNEKECYLLMELSSSKTAFYLQSVKDEDLSQLYADKKHQDSKEDGNMWTGNNKYVLTGDD